MNKTIPVSSKERADMQRSINAFSQRESLKPPLTLEELDALSLRYIRENSLEGSLHDWIMVCLNNSVWRNIVASISHEKRILLMPQCLSNSSQCKGEIDDFGLLCAKCNSCSINKLQDMADSVCTMSIVAEGFTSVISLIESGQIEAVIGVGCLDSLEKAFPLLVNHAVPGIAIPLNCSGCKDTNVDTETVIEALNLRNTAATTLIDLEGLKKEVRELFNLPTINSLIGKPTSKGMDMCRSYLCGDGKRWRPYLLTAVYISLTEQREIPERVKKAAIAIEAFHKASLIHDDIEDNDDYRGAEKTLHNIHGIPIAINIGDMVLGDGYQILTSLGDCEILSVASSAHIRLCEGQGEELEWSKNPTSLSVDKVIEIFEKKTSPAFDVAFEIGAILAGADLQTRTALKQYSTALGIAYQLNDDLQDMVNDSATLRPSAVLAAMCEAYDGDFIAKLKGANDINLLFKDPEISAIRERAIIRTRQLFDHYRNHTMRSLSGIDNGELKRFLFRVTGNILG